MLNLEPQIFKLWNWTLTCNFWVYVSRDKPLHLFVFISGPFCKAAIYSPCNFWQDSNGNKMINEYVRECKIGTGSYGKVVLHRSKKDDKLYAIKMFHKSRLRKLRISPTETAMMDVLREVSIMKELDHPNIVHLVEVIDDPESDHFYMGLFLYLSCCVSWTCQCGVSIYLCHHWMPITILWMTTKMFSFQAPFHKKCPCARREQYSIQTLNSFLIGCCKLVM
jgi:hypothetical protein